MKAAFTPGTTFAGYRVESVIGRGGMGVVYRAQDLSLDRPVALKLIAPELADDEQFRARAHSVDKFAEGSSRFMQGFVKKVFIADSIAPLPDAANSCTSLAVWNTSLSRSSTRA